MNEFKMSLTFPSDARRWTKVGKGRSRALTLALAEAPPSLAAVAHSFVRNSSPFVVWLNRGHRHRHFYRRYHVVLIA